MVISAPVLRPQAHNSLFTKQAKVSNLDDYLRHVNQVLVHQNFNLDFDYSTAITQLKQTLIRLEVAQIKHSAIKVNQPRPSLSSQAQPH